jgi:glycosyltransferase involved in cell wall biosynthesis
MNEIPGPGRQHPGRAAQVSIVIATLNAEETLRRALASIRRHASGAEVIVIDGGSTDATLAILEEHRDILTRLVSEPDDGIYYALNKGLSLATRPWFYVMGADDELLEGFERALRELENPSMFYYGRIWLRQQARPSSGGEYHDRRFLRSWPNHQALLAPTEAMRSIGGFDVRYRLAADWVMHMRLWRGGSRWRYVRYVYCSFSEMGEGVTTGPDARFRQRKLWLGLRYLSVQAVMSNITSSVITRMRQRGQAR